MNFRIADTFTDSLAKLTGDEQKAVKTTAFDLQLNPANPGMKFHRIDKSRDTNFWSVRVSRDIRLIVHKTSSNLLLCYVDHHDPAYHWAERRKLETHPKTGAAQLVELRETVKEITIPKYVEVEEPAPPKPALFANRSDEELLSYGVPKQWLDDVRQANEDSLFEITNHLPVEASEALLELATGGAPQLATLAADDADPFEHPDAQRRFRVMHDVEELTQALEFPWERWSVFLHPAQREIAQRQFKGPARVAGSAGTGKTVVALHRAVELARGNPESQILLTTYSAPLATSLEGKLNVLASPDSDLRRRIKVQSVQDAAFSLYEKWIGEPNVAEKSDIQYVLEQASIEVKSHKFTDRFLMSEWAEIVDGWQIVTWEDYRTVPRLGRKTRLGESQRKLLWSIFERAKQLLSESGQHTPSELFAMVTAELRGAEESPFHHVVVDESQDLSVPQLRFLAALAGDVEDGLFFAGDLGQRIFQTPFSWKSLGVDVRGRSKTLRINYRTSHQIRMQADKLLPPEVSDVDGNTEIRRDTVSAFEGPTPRVSVFDDKETERTKASAWVASLIENGLKPHEIGLFVRTENEFPRAEKVAESANLRFVVIHELNDMQQDAATIMTMHLAKGLEFRAVLVMACDDEIIPLQERIEAVADDADLEEVYNTERHLLYVACTRARDELMVCGVDPASEFLDDLILN